MQAEVPNLWHTFVLICRRTITFKLAKKLNTGAFNEPEQKLWLCLSLKKSKVFVQASASVYLNNFKAIILPKELQDIRRVWFWITSEIMKTN